MKIKTRMLDGTIRMIDTDVIYGMLCGRGQLKYQLAESAKAIEKLKTNLKEKNNAEN